MYRDFYTTMAQVFPVLLLAFVWESKYLERISHEARLTRRHDPSGVLFWTKPRVRVYLLTVATIVILGIVVSVSVLAGMFPDTLAIRIFLTSGLALMLATLMTRIAVEILAATRTEPASEDADIGVDEGEVDGASATATDPATA